MPGSEGSLAQHMAVHIVEMNLVAPLCAACAARLWANPAIERIGLATLVQVLFLWGWHTPAIFALASANPIAMAAMHLSLFAAAVWFWSSVIAHLRTASWTPIAALLVTGKLFCLLGLLLTFAPRAIYAGASIPALESAHVLADQQLAGLLMLAACPVVYVGAAIIVARRWLAEIKRAPGWSYREGAA
ncbi:MAG: cytochrome c oxidase assembly protein [Rhizobiaceae bacterium]|nr:cytochrome c oxidase assembly protein [Rhizobiaceae bacterium]